MKYKSINPSLFKLNRERLYREMKPNTVAVFHSNDLMPRSGDTFHPFRQNADLFYLSGIDQEESILVLFPDCVKEAFREVLFVRRTNETIAIWEGHKLTKEEATAISGIEKVVWLEDMNPVFNELMLLASGIYVNTNENDRFASPVLSADNRFALEAAQKYPAHTLYRTQPILKKLRMIKSKFEVEQIQTACDITEKAFRRVLASVRPNKMEYEIEAEITYEFLRNGANGHAYQPIIASGRNACVLHYIENNKPLQNGDVLLMDFGAEYANYAADLTRSIPVNGRFTKRQKDVYNAVLRVMKAAKTMLVPGNSLDEYHKEVGKIMEAELIGLGLLDRHAVAHQDPATPLYKKYFMHGTSHHLGLDVHDLCERYTVFREGMIFTCEPGIYILEENLGIRIENDILITDEGQLDLMENIPIEADEIEHLIHSSVSVA